MQHSRRWAWLLREGGSRRGGGGKREARVTPDLNVDWLECGARSPPASPPSPAAPPPPRQAALPAPAREGTLRPSPPAPCGRGKAEGGRARRLAPPAPDSPAGTEPRGGAVAVTPRLPPGRSCRPATAPRPRSARPAPGPPRRHGGATFLTAVPPPGRSAPPAAPAPSLACPHRLS